MRRNQQSNQRQTPRRTAYIIAEYTVNEGIFRDIIRNIGPSGMFINTRRHIDENQAIVVQFPLFEFDHNIQVSGRVVRSDANGFAVIFDTEISEMIGEDGDLHEIVHEIDRNGPAD